MTEITLQRPEGRIHIEPVRGGHRVRLEPFNQGKWTQFTHHETTYPVGLIQAICQVKEFGNICDEMRRDEVASYVGRSLRFAIFPYFEEADFRGKRILDFGCGMGASSMWLSRMFPESEIVGVELEPHLLEIARMRRDFHRADKVTLLQSPSGDSLPPDLGTFDFVVFSALFEHLLPHERPALLPKVWETLSPGGVLFLCETPHRYHFKESHTTNLYGLNYLPDRLTLWATRRFSKRYGPDVSWEFLLREGIRGGTVREILGILKATGSPPELLTPRLLGTKDLIDVWLESTSKTLSKRLMARSFKILKTFTGIIYIPSLTLAIRKKAGAGARPARGLAGSLRRKQTPSLPEPGGLRGVRAGFREAVADSLDGP